MSKIQIVPQEFSNLEKSEAQEIEKVFKPMVEMLKEMEKEYNEIVSKKEINQNLCSDARELRLRIVKTRTGANKIREEKKKIYLIKGNAIQGFYNIFLSAVKEREDNLLKIEKYYENIEKERLKNLQKSRENELLKYEVENVEGLNLSEMSEDVWSNFLAGTKTNYESKKEAERKAEEERIELQRKKELLNSREKEVAVYTYLNVAFDLTLETTEDEYCKIMEKLKKAKTDYEIEQEKIKKEKEEAVKKQKEIEAQQEKDRKEAKKKQIEAEARIKAEKEAKEKLEREKREKEEKELRKKIEEENRIKAEAEEKEKAEKNKKYLDFLKENNFDKTKMEVRQEGNKFTIWEKISEITI